MKIEIKPLILGIESTGVTCGVALSEGDTVIGSYSLFGKNLHDKLLGELIKRLLNDTETSINNLSAVAVSSGPGSFTGLRIGASIAKGICLENEPKLIAVQTMKSLAFAATQRFDLLTNNYLAIILPFYKDQYYFQVFDDKLNEIKPIEIVDICFLQNFKSTLDDKIYNFISPDNSIKEIFKESFLFMPLLPDYIAKKGYFMFLSKEFTNSEEFVPLYVQEFIPKFKIVS